MSLGDFYDEYFRKLFEEEDYPYINEFHKKHTEACEKENERVRSMHFTAEYARAQSRRMEELVRKQEEKEREQKRLEKQEKKTPTNLKNNATQCFVALCKLTYQD